MEEIAKEIGIDKEDIVFALDAIQTPMSLQEPVYSDGDDVLYVMDQVRAAVEDVPGVVSLKIDLVFEPVWDKSRMSEEALVELGLDD